jgi:DNA-binding winged helix-turn-helix (wHTH) protein/tetratricopeptide (TPR) repeat protein
MSLDLKSKFHQINLNGVKPSGSVIYGFEDYRLDAEHLMLYHNGDEVSLTPKQIETLIALIEERGEIVSKEVLMHRLWGDTAVEESNLTQNIYILRKVLGKTRDGMPMIETLRRRGYRFNAEVTDHRHRIATVSAAIRSAELAGIPDQLSPNEPTDVPERDTPDKRSNKEVAAAIVGIGLLAAVIVAGYFAFFAKPVDAGVKTLAILPLKPIDPSNRNGLYEHGVADSLIQRLNPVKGFVVRQLSATRKYTGLDQDALAAGREQKVDYVLASNYQFANGRIKVTSQLLDVATAKIADTFEVETDSADLFSAQAAIARDIANKLLAKFGSEAVEFQAKGGTNNPEAYGLYLQAVNLSEERGVQKVEKALENLDTAVALDPNYALAWAFKARTHADIVAHTDSNQHANYQRAMEAISKALAIDPNLSEAYSALCQNKNRYEYDARGAESACKRAVELEPNSPVAHKTYANFLYSRGSFDEAIVEIKTAMELQPVSYRNQQMYALTLYFARQYAESEDKFKSLLELSPNHNYIHGRLIILMQEQGKESEAFEYLIKMLTVDNAPVERIDRFKTAFRTAGWNGVLAERIKDFEAEAVTKNYQLACLYSKIGNKDRALAYLEKAYQERSFQMAMLRVEPQLDPLRNDPRFADLIRRVEGK